jgi:hypothetical protein
MIGDLCLMAQWVQGWGSGFEAARGCRAPGEAGKTFVEGYRKTGMPEE